MNILSAEVRIRGEETEAHSMEIRTLPDAITGVPDAMSNSGEETTSMAMEMSIRGEEIQSICEEMAFLSLEMLSD